MSLFTAILSVYIGPQDVPEADTTTSSDSSKTQTIASENVNLPHGKHMTFDLSFLAPSWLVQPVNMCIVWTEKKSHRVQQFHLFVKMWNFCQRN